VDLGNNGTIDYWQGGALDKAILIIPGFDPLDTDTTSRFLALMYRIAPSLISEGYDIAIGNYAYPWKSLDDLTLQVQAWVTDAWARNWTLNPDTRIQVAGVSQGGVLLRKALRTYFIRDFLSSPSPCPSPCPSSFS
jgi:hypothetical protein